VSSFSLARENSRKDVRWPLQLSSPSSLTEFPPRAGTLTTATDLVVEEEKGRKERRLEPGEYHIFEFPLLDPKDLLA
jgi:hypothetical protein